MRRTSRQANTLSRLNVGAALAATALLWAPAASAASFDLEYDASILNVVQLGSMKLKGKIAPSGYNATASVQTAGMAALFDNTRITASSTGRVGASGLAWMRYDLSHSYAKKYRKVVMTKSGSTVAATITPKFSDMGTPPASAAQKNISRDPVSTLVEMGRSVGAKRACAGTFPVFDGKQYYTLTLTPKTKGTYKGGGYSGAALVCYLRYTPFAGFKPSKPGEGKIPTAEIWFGDPAVGGFAAPLRIQVPTPAGAGRLDLKRMALSAN